jgi:hypothetical protein
VLGLTQYLSRTRIRPREEKEIVHEAGHGLDLFQDGPQNPLILRWITTVPQGNLNLSPENRERGFQLVRRIGREPAHLSECRFEAGQHLVQCAR